MDNLVFLAGMLIYILLGRWVMRRLAGCVRETGLAGLNLAGVFFFLFYSHGDATDHYVVRFGIYLACVAGFFVALRLFADRRGAWPWLAFFTPIVLLIVDRYIPSDLGRTFGWRGIPQLVGISYLSFRCSRLVLEVRNGAVKMPNLPEYFNFAFFLPTMLVGPINSYANFRRGFEATPYEVPVGRAALRILVGAVKYLFLSSLFNRLGYSGLMLDEHPHHWIDLPVSMLFYYLYLYCNFSGFCDMAIGVAALTGIPVPENFDNPFAARNVKDFWNRWHITLSTWMRDVVFSPLSKFLVRLMGVHLADHAIALTITVVFLLVGIWHGAGWNYALFGLAQALGVVTVHYYTIYLKKRLGRDGFKAYNENKVIHAMAVVVTFCYYAVSLFFFANTISQMKEILATLK